MARNTTTTTDGLIATAIDAGNLMDCADINISDNAADGFIANYINSEILRIVMKMLQVD